MSVTHPTPAELEGARRELDALSRALGEVLFGQPTLVENVLTGLLAGGHILLEGLPGLGKTQLVKGLARALGLEQKRIQFTPDLMPGDITGTLILQETSAGRRFEFHRGPIFAHLVLADEINRASPKTQSALLEAMQERSVTVMGESHSLPSPFFVLATQNPIELEGTYPLPEAQLDRFLFKLEFGRSDVAVLEQIIRKRELGRDVEVPQVTDRDRFVELIGLARRVHLPDVVVRYIARLVDATHTQAAIRFGASPRAALSLAGAAKARALLAGRPNASFEDVLALAKPVLRHRMILGFEAKLEGRHVEDLVDELLRTVEVQERGLPASLGAVRS
ncbi:MAG: MoxR family ATPase [Deltaproteobacteria bacterium]|nr:MoxR family ATPase [Deltaproteobacteria bacterium]